MWISRKHYNFLVETNKKLISENNSLITELYEKNMQINDFEQLLETKSNKKTTRKPTKKEEPKKTTTRKPRTKKEDK